MNEFELFDVVDVKFPWNQSAQRGMVFGLDYSMSKAGPQFLRVALGKLGLTSCYPNECTVVNDFKLFGFGYDKFRAGEKYLAMLPDLIGGSELKRLLCKVSRVMGDVLEIDVIGLYTMKMTREQFALAIARVGIASA